MLKRVGLLGIILKCILKANTPSIFLHDEAPFLGTECSHNTEREELNSMNAPRSPLYNGANSGTPVPPNPDPNNDTEDFVAVAGSPIMYNIQGTSYFPYWPPSFNPVYSQQLWPIFNPTT